MAMPEKVRAADALQRTTRNLNGLNNKEALELTIRDAALRLGSRDIEKVVGAAQELETLVFNLSKDIQDSTIKREELSELQDFLDTQDSYAYNLAGRIAEHIQWALSSEGDVSATLALLRLLRGLCLLHRPSRSLFDDDLLLSMLIKSIKNSNPDIQNAIVNTLMAVLVREVSIMRRFERLDGIKYICDAFKRSSTSKEVKMTILQFLFFYLIPETKADYIAGHGDAKGLQRKTTEEKQVLLGKYLSNVDGLVRELNILQPFGQSDSEW